MKKPSSNAKNTCLEQALHEIVTSINNIDGWGSVEIIIQNYKVTQVTEKNIRKPILTASRSTD